MLNIYIERKLASFYILVKVVCSKDSTNCTLDINELACLVPLHYSE